MSPPSEMHTVRGLNSGALGTSVCVVVRTRGVRGVGWVDNALVMEVWCVCVYVCVLYVHKTQIEINTHKLSVLTSEILGLHVGW